MTPPCMKGIKQLPRKEKTPYKPSDLWESREHAIFLKYCPNIRDRCYHSLANNMSARPSVTEAIFEMIDEFQGISTIVGPIPTFSGDCTQILGASQTATGTIAAGESQTCNIQNTFIINAMT